MVFKSLYYTFMYCISNSHILVLKRLILHLDFGLGNTLYKKSRNFF